MKILICAILVLGSLTSQFAHAAIVDISHDESDCRDGWASMDVVVSVDVERFRFEPSCNFSFSQSFQTSQGLTCQIEAGMCSSFSPQERIEVRCDDGGSDSVSVDCPKE